MLICHLYHQDHKYLERIDLEIVGLWPVKVQMYRLGFVNKLTVLKTPVSVEYLFMAMSKKSKFIKHLPYISFRLKQMHENGRIDNILKKHLSSFEHSN